MTSVGAAIVDILERWDDVDASQIRLAYNEESLSQVPRNRSKT